MTPGRVLIVGAGLAGSRCAETLRSARLRGRGAARRRGAAPAVRAARALEGVPRGSPRRGRPQTRDVLAREGSRAPARHAGSSRGHGRSHRRDRCRAASVGRARPRDGCAAAAARPLRRTIRRPPPADDRRRRKPPRGDRPWTPARHRWSRVHRSRGRLDRPGAGRRGDHPRGPERSARQGARSGGRPIAGRALPRTRRRPSPRSAGRASRRGPGRHATGGRPRRRERGPLRRAPRRGRGGSSRRARRRRRDPYGCVRSHGAPRCLRLRRRGRVLATLARQARPHGALDERGRDRARRSRGPSSGSQSPTTTSPTSGRISSASGSSTSVIRTAGRGSSWTDEPESFSARYHREDGCLVAALLVNRRAEVGAARRELAELRPAA